MLRSIQSASEDASEAKIEQSYRVERTGELLLSATVTLAVIDPAGKIQRIPDSLRRLDLNIKE